MSETKTEEKRNPFHKNISLILYSLGGVVGDDFIKAIGSSNRQESIIATRAVLYLLGISHIPEKERFHFAEVLSNTAYEYMGDEKIVKLCVKAIANMGIQEEVISLVQHSIVEKEYPEGMTRLLIDVFNKCQEEISGLRPTFAGEEEEIWDFEALFAKNAPLYITGDINQKQDTFFEVVDPVAISFCREQGTPITIDDVKGEPHRLNFLYNILDYFRQRPYELKFLKGFKEMVEETITD